MFFTLEKMLTQLWGHQRSVSFWPKVSLPLFMES